MKKKITFIILALLALLVTALIHLPSSVSAIDELYIFGDSLSDTGMTYRATPRQYPPSPYFRGRYSNGQVWVEYLAKDLDLEQTQTFNFAYGGARTDSQGNGMVPSLLTQVETFTKTHPERNPKALYVVWAGANDYLQGVTSPTTPVSNITEAITKLSNVGARHFLVANLPDLGQIPGTRLSSGSEQLSTLTREHNQALQRSLTELSQKQPDLQILILDVNALYQKAISQPSAFGFSTVTKACFSASQVCNHPNQFLFWDDVHPTTAAHRIIGEKAFALLAQEGLVGTRSAVVQ